MVTVIGSATAQCPPPHPFPRRGEGQTAGARVARIDQQLEALGPGRARRAGPAAGEGGGRGRAAPGTGAGPRG